MQCRNSSCSSQPGDMTLIRPSNAQCGLFKLPNEILLHVLSPLPTTSLLPLTLISLRIHDLILRILHRRLLLAASLYSHKLILECYHPASKFTEPYYHCEYLSTPGLSSTSEGEGLAYETGSHASRLGKLSGLYSRFRPLARDDKQRVPRQHPAGGEMPERTLPSRVPVEEREQNENDAGEALVAHRVALDPEDMFSQLCVVTNLVKMGPRNGVFMNLVTVNDGLVRIGRSWLKERAVANESFKRASKAQEPPGERTLWLDNKTDVGLTVRVKEMSWRRAVPVLLHQDEEPAVTYNVEYEELLIRTTHLLLAVEESLQQEQNDELGRAMVFGAFVDRT